MKILVVSPYLPHANVGHGGGTAIYHMLRTLASRRHDMTVLCFLRSGEAGLEADLESSGVTVEAVPFRSGADKGAARIALVLDRGIRWLKAAFEGVPYRSVRYRSDAMSRRLQRLVTEGEFDAVEVEYFAMAGYARQVGELRSRRPGEPSFGTGPTPVGGPRRPRILLSTHEAETLVRLRRFLDISNRLTRPIYGIQLWRAGRYERRAVGWADETLCVSEIDRRILAALSGSTHLHTVPLGVDMELLPAAAPEPGGSPRILFVGSFDHPPNREAASLLSQTILPALRREHPELQLDIAGRRPPSELRSDPEKGLNVLGFVEDLSPLFDASTLFVAPLFSGGGIKIKVLEALGRGRAVVTTPIGLDGIDAVVGRDAASANDPEGFIQETLGLLAAPGHTRAEMGDAGRRLVEERYSWDSIARRIESLVAGA